MKNKNLLESFNHALEGLIFAIKRERNLKIHFSFGFMVILFSLICDLNKVEFCIVLLTIMVVIVSELFNTVVENVVDICCGNQYNNLAKVTKDLAAGIVLFTSFTAVIIGYLIFFDKLAHIFKDPIDFIDLIPTHLVVISLIVIIIVSIIFKLFFRKESLLSGGMPSGHTAIAFGAAVAIFFLNKGSFIITILSYLTALLVAQSRYEGKIHSIKEIVVGALLGTIIVILFFKLFL